MVQNMAQHKILVITIVLILKFIVIVSNHDELEHHLATDCEGKRMIADLILESFRKERYLLLDFVCGDKCIYYFEKCECGDTTINFDDASLYCCIPRNETCTAQGI